jgi:tellurium resistance protein TerD
MPINLSKGQTINLSKEGTNGLKNVTIGLSWGAKVLKASPTKEEAKGFMEKFSSFFKGGETKITTPTSVPKMDIDSSVFLIKDTNQRLTTVYYGNLRAPGVRHAGDDLTGNDKKGKHDNEEIHVDFDKIPRNVHKLFVVANVFSPITGHFGWVPGSYIRIKDEKGNEVVRYELGADFKDMKGIVVAELYRDGNGDWNFRAIGKATKGNSMRNLEGLCIQGDF